MRFCINVCELEIRIFICSQVNLILAVSKRLCLLSLTQLRIPLFLFFYTHVFVGIWVDAFVSP